MDLTILLQTTLNGLMTGGVYAVVAVGLTLIFGVMKIVNFAQGEFVMLGMYASWALATLVGIGPYPGLLLVAAIMFGVGWLTFKFLIERILGKSDEAFILLTLGLSIFLQNVTLLVFGADYLTVATTVKDAALHFGGLSVSVPRVVAFVVALALVAGLTLFLHRTDLGRAMRATAENREVATLLGINSVRCFVIAFSIGIVFAGVAGVLLTPMFYVYPGVGTLFNLTAFVVCRARWHGVGLRRARRRTPDRHRGGARRNLCFARSGAVLHVPDLHRRAAGAAERTLRQECMMTPGRVLVIAAAVLALAFPVAVSTPYYVHTVFMVFLFATIGLGWNLIGGHGAQLSLGAFGILRDRRLYRGSHDDPCWHHAVDWRRGRPCCSPVLPQ